MMVRGGGACTDAVAFLYRYYDAPLSHQQAHPHSSGVHSCPCPGVCSSVCASAEEEASEYKVSAATADRHADEERDALAAVQRDHLEEEAAAAGLMRCQGSDEVASSEMYRRLGDVFICTSAKPTRTYESCIVLFGGLHVARWKFAAVRPGSLFRGSCS